MDILSVLPILQMLLTFMNICVLAFAFVKFLGKPRNTLEEKVQRHEIKIAEIEASLKQGNDRFRRQETTSEVMQTCMLALIDFELSYCIHTNYTDTADLERAKVKLHEHLSSSHD